MFTRRAKSKCVVAVVADCTVCCNHIRNGTVFDAGVRYIFTCGRSAVCGCVYMCVITELLCRSVLSNL